jgi:HK97 family phage major capsid protein
VTITTVEPTRLQQLEVLHTEALHAAENLAQDIREGRANKAAGQAAATRLAAIDAEVKEARAAYVRQTKAAEHRVFMGQTGETLTAATASPTPAHVTNEPRTYAPQREGGENSYFRDLYEARTSGNREAVERLVRNDKERRALGNSGQTSVIGAGGGAGGEFSPPAWLVNDFIALARPGRVAADRAHQQILPSGIANVNLPRVATGATTAVQATQNVALSQTDITSNSVSSSITTVGGKQVVSLQLLQQSGLNFDEVILGDLASDYAKQLDLQFLAGSGASGQLRGVTGVAGATVTYTDASPAVAGAGKFYAQVAKAIQSVATSRYAQPTCIVMHPRRWAWASASFDSSNRPLIVPSGQGFNSVATFESTQAQGLVGEMLGLPVYVDPNISITDGAGTNQDIVYVLKADDLWLYESPLQAEAFTSTYADTMGVLFRLFAYSASIPDRYPSSVCLIRGTGLVTPAF